MKMRLNLCLTAVALLSVGLSAADYNQDAYDGLFDDLDLDKVCSRPQDVRNSLLSRDICTFQVLSMQVSSVFSQLNVSNAVL